MNKGKILIGLLAGAAAGATLGMLFANGNDSDSVEKTSGIRERYSEAVKEKVVNFLFALIDKITADKEKASA